MWGIWRPMPSLAAPSLHHSTMIDPVDVPRLHALADALQGTRRASGTWTAARPKRTASAWRGGCWSATRAASWTPSPSFRVQGRRHRPGDAHHAGPERPRAGERPGQASLIVDDCALTGAARTLRQTDAAHVVFAHLHPRSCGRRCGARGSARASLRRGPRPPGPRARPARVPAHAAWQAHWEQRTGADRYWYGSGPGLLSPGASRTTRSGTQSRSGLRTPGASAGPMSQEPGTRRPAAAPAMARKWRVPPEVATGWLDEALWLCRAERRERCGGWRAWARTPGTRSPATGPAAPPAAYLPEPVHHGRGAGAGRRAAVRRGARRAGAARAGGSARLALPGNRRAAQPTVSSA